MKTQSGSKIKITSLTTETFEWPRRKPISNGKHTYTHVGLTLIKIETDAGITGIGLGGGNVVERATVQKLTSKLLGEDPIDCERLWHTMWVPSLGGGASPPVRSVPSTLDYGIFAQRSPVCRSTRCWVEFVRKTGIDCFAPAPVPRRADTVSEEQQITAITEDNPVSQQI